MKYKKLSDQQFTREANALARDYAPDIKECPHCGHPRLDPFLCTFCGGDPDYIEEED